MGILRFTHPKFYFVTETISENRIAIEARWYSDSLNVWSTRSLEKAVKLRQFADESAEIKFKKNFTTLFKLPEQIIYPDHLEPKVFQFESAWSILGHSPAYCADEAGLGKTITATLCMNTVPGPALIICPSYLKYNWQKELRTWLTSKRSISIIEKGKTDGEAYNSSIVIVPDSLIDHPWVKLELQKRHFRWLIIDEAHRVKSETAKRTQAILGDQDCKTRSMYDIAQRTVYLSGTPIPNARPIELWPIIERTAPSVFNHSSKHQYGVLFCGAKSETIYKNKKPEKVWSYLGSASEELWSDLVYKDFMVRHLKSDVMKEIPPKTRGIVYVDTPKKILPYERKVLASHTISDLLDDEYGAGDLAIYRRECGLAKVDVAVEMIKDLLATGEKLVVFAHHIDVIDKLEKQLEEFNPLVIRGSVSAKEKQKRVDLFQNDPNSKLLIGNIDSAGVGWTMTKSFRGLFVEWSYVYGINEQCEDRIFRMTQESKSYFQYLTLRNSLDERMIRMNMNKEQSGKKLLAQRKVRTK